MSMPVCAPLADVVARALTVCARAESKADPSKQDLRHRIQGLVQEALRELFAVSVEPRGGLLTLVSRAGVVSREDEAKMLWTRTDYNSLRVSCLYHVALRGYPYDKHHKPLASALGG